MKNKQLNILLFLITFLIVACSTKRKLIEKKKTEFGTLKFYIETDLNSTWYKKRILAKIDNSTYIFYSDKIIKELEGEKRLFHSLIFDNLEKWKEKQYSKALNEIDSLSGFENIEKWSDSEYFQKLNKTDSLVLSEGNKVLDSLNWSDFKKFNGAIGFLTEVY